MTVDGIAEYKFDNWKLLARVTQKSEKSSWKKENSAGLGGWQRADEQ